MNYDALHQNRSSSNRERAPAAVSTARAARPKMLPRPGCLSATARAACPAPAAVHTRIQAPEPGLSDAADMDRQVNGPGKAVDGAARSQSGGWSSVAKKVAFCEDDVHPELCPSPGC